MSNIDERLSQARAALLRSKPANMHAGEPGARILLALQAGERIVARKPFSSGNGHDLQPGEPLKSPEAWPGGRLASMAAHGFVCSEREWQESQAYNEKQRIFTDELEPLSAKLGQARQDAQKAAQEMASLQAQLMQAKRKAESAGDAVRLAEQELEQALNSASKMLSLTS